jgi:hypothetical protein
MSRRLESELTKNQIAIKKKKPSFKSPSQGRPSFTDRYNKLASQGSAHRL